MKSADYERFMETAIAEAKASLKEGNKGVGALLIKNGKVIVKAHDTEVTEMDPTAHAEMNALRKAFKKYGADLTGCSMVSTLEPCPMCAGALVWSRLSEMIYGASTEDAIKLGRTLIPIKCKEIIHRSLWRIRVKAGILEDECLRLYSNETRKIHREVAAMGRAKSH